MTSNRSSLSIERPTQKDQRGSPILDYKSLLYALARETRTIFRTPDPGRMSKAREHETDFTTDTDALEASQESQLQKQ